MCGIAGIIDLAGTRPAPEGAIKKMAAALFHRGPDEDGYFIVPGLSMASRRLSIVGLADGQQPISNEDKSVSVVFNGELFDYIEKRAELESKGHRFVTHCDTEVIPHLWEECGEAAFEKLRGQFAIALWDSRQRELFLGRDRFGISPLYWTQQGDWLLFASEIKGLLASGMFQAEPDLRGIDHIFTFSALPAPITCFKGVQLLRPGHYLRIRPAAGGRAMSVSESAFWEMDFPDAGDELDSDDPKFMVDELERVMMAAVEMRLRADVPVGAYLSGGIDSSMIVALAAKLRGKPLSTYTVRVDEPGLDELSAANLVARHVGTTPPIVQDFRPNDVIDTYPELIKAAECPVIDTSCAALLLLAHRVRTNDQKVVLTGEGADEWMFGYPWYKVSKALGYLDVVPEWKLSDRLRRAVVRMEGAPAYPLETIWKRQQAIGGPNAWLDFYGLIALSKLRLYGEPMRKIMETTDPWAGLGMNLERAKKWHPMNRGVWMAAKVNLAGHLLQAKGDRVAMHSSVEVRYPFLDEAVFAYLARVHPRWKLRGFRDKHILRLMAERWLPRQVYNRRKVIFRAPLDSFHTVDAPFIEQLLSEESLRRTGYFDVAAVTRWRKEFKNLSPRSISRLSVEMGLTAVVATQLWHHTYISGGLTELPGK